jgi:hypothetical protein
MSKYVTGMSHTAKGTQEDKICIRFSVQKIPMRAKPFVQCYRTYTLHCALVLFGVDLHTNNRYNFKHVHKQYKYV